MYYMVVVVPYLNAEDLLAPRLLADSITYITICPEVVSASEWYWLRDAGPCLVLIALNHDTGLVSLFNAVLLVVVALLFGRCYQVDGSKLLLLLLINPLTFLSLFGPNKEVFGLAATMCLLIFFRQRSFWSLMAALALSFSTRVSMLAAVLLFLMLCTLLVRAQARNIERRFYSLFLTAVAAFSAVAFVVNTDAQALILGDVFSADDNSRSTLFSLQLDALNAKGLYLATYFLRLLLNLYGALANVASVTLATHGVYYAVGIMGSSLIFLAMTAIALCRPGGLLKLNEQGLHISLFVAFYTLMLCISPVIQHRYFFPLYPILVLAMVTPKGGRRRRIAMPVIPVTTDTKDRSAISA